MIFPQRAAFIGAIIVGLTASLLPILASAQSVPTPNSLTETATALSVTSADSFSWRNFSAAANGAENGVGAVPALAPSTGIENVSAAASALDSPNSMAGSGTGSNAELFVFNQVLNVAPTGSLRDASGGAQVALADNALSSVAGVVALNQAAGVANQQGSIVRAVAAGNGISPAGAANSVNVENQQSLNVAGQIEAVGSGGYSASIGGNALQNVTGVVAINQAAGVANQQVSTVLWYGAGPSSGAIGAQR